jgi:hypothetical protein
MFVHRHTLSLLDTRRREKQVVVVELSEPLPTLVAEVVDRDYAGRWNAMV